MVSGWAIKACLGSWPFSLGVGEGHSRKMCEWPEWGVGAELLDGLRPSSGVREDPGGHPACSRHAAILPCLHQLSQNGVGGGFSCRAGLVRVAGVPCALLRLLTPSLLQAALPTS